MNSEDVNDNFPPAKRKKGCPPGSKTVSEPPAGVFQSTTRSGSSKQEGSSVSVPCPVTATSSKPTRIS